MPNSLHFRQFASSHPLWTCVFCVVLATCLFSGCRKSASSQMAQRLGQRIEEKKTKTDSLRTAMQFLDQMEPLTRDNFITEIKLQLNTWIQEADRNSVQYSATDATGVLDAEMLAAVEATNPLKQNFGYWDVDYIFQCYVMNATAAWIAQSPVRDQVVLPYLEAHRDELDEEGFRQLEEAYKLFDWTMRNVRLKVMDSSVSDLSTNPRTLSENSDTLGCSYLPFETAAYCEGDFVERGRVFNALAAQRGIQTYWVAVGANEPSSGKLWAIAVAAGKNLFLFEPKLGFPVFDPDETKIATLNAAQDNPRILRRMALPGFEYALSSADLKDIRLYVDAEPCADSARMKLLESKLLTGERMVLYRSFDDATQLASELAPDSKVQLWNVPLLAQIHATALRDMLRTVNESAQDYMRKRSIWMTPNPISIGHFKHLKGQFENGDDGQAGALRDYVNSLVDELSIQRLSFDPKVREELQVVRMPGEPLQVFEQRIVQMQAVYRRAKRDGDFLLGQLHFDRGNYSEARSRLENILSDDTAQRWYIPASYTLARIQIELGQLEQAAEQLITYRDNPREVGNRMRLRYLRRMIDSQPEQSDQSDDS
ncbi:MAG TPA: hypothetical protein DDW52_24870 [Planctomycetaceae bacterium]|nr:hypothetical protein [Planctomycetaceae bacterium]